MRPIFTTINGDTYFLDKLIKISAVKINHSSIDFIFIFEGDEKEMISCNIYGFYYNKPIEIGNIDLAQLYKEYKSNINDELTTLMKQIRHTCINNIKEGVLDISEQNISDLIRTGLFTTFKKYILLKLKEEDDD